MNLLQRILNKLVHMPICRAYSKVVLKDKPADRIMCFLSNLYFWHVHGYWPRLQARSFEEKVYNRMLFDRNPIWTTVSDKLLVRDYVSSKVTKNHLVPLLWKGELPEDIPFDELPEKFVIKANHGCKFNLIISDKSKLDEEEAKRQMRKWLKENFCTDNFIGIEWAYKNIKPMILIESFLEDKGKVPLDYKFFCFSGRVEYVQVNFDRFGDPSEKFFDRNFTPLDLWNGTKQYQGKVVSPNNYEVMIEIAESLSEGFDFIRVDLYSVGERIYFGELTCYPGGGRIPFVPEAYDYEFGDKWVIRNRMSYNGR